MSIQSDLGLASDPNTPPEVLNELAHHTKYSVRYNVAYNPSSPVSALETLVNEVFIPSYDGIVHYYVAQNPSTPEFLLERLTNHNNALLRNYILQHPNTTQRLKNYLIAKSYVTSNRH